MGDDIAGARFRIGPLILDIASAESFGGAPDAGQFVPGGLPGTGFVIEKLDIQAVIVIAVRLIDDQRAIGGDRAAARDSGAPGAQHQRYETDIGIRCFSGEIPFVVTVGCTGQITFISIGIKGDGQPHGFQVVEAVRRLSAATCFIEGGQQHGGENGDDCNDDQQFYQCESVSDFFHFVLLRLLIFFIGNLASGHMNGRRSRTFFSGTELSSSPGRANCSSASSVTAPKSPCRSSNPVAV